MPKLPPRRATLVLCRPDGTLLGRLPEVRCSTPWWLDAASVIAATKVAYGLEPVLLRLLDSERPRPHGGGVTYLAEVDGALPEGARQALEPVEIELDDQPLRLPYARPGGPARDLEWATTSLADAGMEPGTAPEQIRSWNLSSIWRLPLADGTSAWLKAVPPFFAHEGAMLERLQQAPVAVPRPIAVDGRRILLADIAGEDRYDAEPPELLRMVFGLVHLQEAWFGREGELLDIGLPDWRGPALAGRFGAMLDDHGASLDGPQRDAIRRLVDGLPARFDAIRRCDLPDTLVHGDFHPGNVRGTPDRLTYLDWGDCGVGNPLLDLPAFLEMAPSSHRRRIREAWLGAWRRAVPGCDPDTAATLLAPVSAARQALIYATFVANIEPVERRYHAADIVDWLGRTAKLVMAEESG